MATPIGVTIRNAALADADAVAEIHAASWRRHYRGAYADSFLDGDITADRRDVWNQRLNEPGSGCTLVADDGGTPVGFLHVVFDENARWGSLVDNLHVVFARQRCGLGTALLRSAARAAAAGATSGRLYLWVLEQNTAAQAFYRARGGSPVEEALVAPPGGVASRLAGNPRKLRFAWPDVETLVWS
jgi:ribosomal protein S18 acetylase RimI-like enzyme